MVVPVVRAVMAESIVNSQVNWNSRLSYTNPQKF